MARRSPPASPSQSSERRGHAPPARQNPHHPPSPGRPGRRAPGRLLECRRLGLDPGPPPPARTRPPRLALAALAVVLLGACSSAGGSASTPAPATPAARPTSTAKL